MSSAKSQFSTTPSSARVVVMTGATGFVGQRLARELLLRGYRLKVLTRDPERARKTFPYPAEFRAWNPEVETPPVDFLEGAYGVLHLAGEPVAGTRWSPKRKAAILESRELGTKNLVAALLKLEQAPAVLVSASAIGFYGSRGEELLDENSAPGSGFLPDVCRVWEERAFEARSCCRTVALRIGVVLGTESGALAEMLPVFRLGLGGPIAGGRAWMSWIHVDDLVDLFVHALEDQRCEGVLNAVAPEPTRNDAFTKALSVSLGRPALFPVPSLALKTLFGEMSSILLASQRVVPRRTLETGFRFRYAEIASALSELLAPKGLRGAYTFRADQFLARPKGEVFHFFSDASNLETITPDWLRFQIVKAPDSLREGSLIDYRLRVRGLPVRWRTLISKWKDGEEFEDRALKSPYRDWDHSHVFHEVPGGTLVSDRVYYRLPFSILGDLVAALWVLADVRKIFGFRRKKIDDLFGAKGG